MNKTPPLVPIIDATTIHASAVCLQELYTFSWYLYHELASIANDNAHISQVCSRVSPHPVLERMRRDRSHGLLDPFSTLAKEKGDYIIRQHNYYWMLGTLYSVAHLREWGKEAPYSMLLSQQRGFSVEKYKRIVGKQPYPSVLQAAVLIDVYLQIAELLEELKSVSKRPMIGDFYGSTCLRELRKSEQYLFVESEMHHLSEKREIEGMTMVLGMFTGMSPNSKKIEANHRSLFFDSSNPNQNAELFENENPLYAYGNDPYVYQAFVGYAAAKQEEFGALGNAYEILGKLVMCAVMLAD